MLGKMNKIELNCSSTKKQNAVKTILTTKPKHNQQRINTFFYVFFYLFILVLYTSPDWAGQGDHGGVLHLRQQEDRDHRRQGGGRLNHRRQGGGGLSQPGHWGRNLPLTTH